ncbi:GNAT family N-acetyltransferase [Sphaerisporangium sp. B11E5]|uniref:GNAT family N-acetyltransferase n=1 Tax=Sphaerisporangium sp. B11E5 TaxID=3153563 RepID=UPI00325C8701
MHTPIPPVVAHGAMRDTEQPDLRTGELVLRPWQAGDVAVVREAFTDPAIQLWNLEGALGEDQAARLIAVWQARWRLETGASWAVTDGRAVLGRVALRTIDLALGLGEVAYWTLPAARGRGVTVRAVTELARWAFDDLGLHRLELRHSMANPASCRVAVRTGFTAEGVLRSSLRHADGWHDMHIHGLVR